MTAIGATTEAGGALRLPITGGELTAAPLAGRIEHDGGRRVHTRRRHVDLTALRLDATTDVITATVRGCRVPATESCPNSAATAASPCSPAVWPSAPSTSPRGFKAS